ncbi:EAL domain-containing protein [Rhizobium sp. CB3090]|uniref:putative bifunctional diguanylate cyclase/phosphodiesterase n=1 Tax=Rhizobium sp. CB3090 TaxID=3039156 RepID=UPI0024B084FC|nr:EAL domain-containing protein [Rhizobium sp. CB3090]WFU09459.1 EAL domain-containing protein [Rhizobium sp. CB3090]
MRNLLSGLGLQKEHPTFMVAQYKALSSQIPVLYILLIINALAVAITHIHTAPMWLALYVPVGLSVLCVFRIIWWHMHGQDPVSADRAYSVMRRTVVLAGVLTLAFGTWAVALYQYGNAYQQGQISYFLVVTGISCVFCLMHLPAAALLTTAITFSFMVVTFMFSGNSVFVATATSVIFLSFPFVRVINSYFRNFAGLVQLTEELGEKQAEAERLNLINSRNALQDQLTGLANRRSFFRELQDLLQQRPEEPPIVGLVDLDGFKPVNDVFGHAAGDLVLKETAERFVALMGGRGTIARLGGDEFGVIFPSDLNRNCVSKMGQAFCAALREPYDVPGGSIRISGSCGIVVPEGSGHTAEQLYEKADFALYQVKNRRSGSVEFFSHDLEEILQQRHLIELELQGDNFGKELSLEYQPIIDLEDGHVVGFEALARWNSARLGRISPSAFIPAAERTAMIGKMTRILFAEALQALSIMPPPLRMSFNLSARDICDHETSMALLGMIHAAKIDPRRIEFEITETALLSDFDTAYEVISLLRTAGITIALDDFGTGFSSLSHVHRLEFDKIKIDKSFVMQFERDVRCMNITRSVANLCRNLGIVSVAEGVESAATAEALHAFGVRLAQGYHFSRPLRLHDAIAFAEASETGIAARHVANA